MDREQRFLFRRWLDGCVVFDRQLGDTHALDPTAAALFFSLQDGNAGSSSLTEVIAPQYPDSTIEELALRVDSTVAHLRSLGLVDAYPN
jgi:PqqD family protein of HPr-rel-A system